MPKISVITPTVRKEGLDLVRRALKRQTFADFEWLVGSSFDPEIPEAVWMVDDFKDGFWTLNRIYNRLIGRSSTELIISWQDFTFADPDTLEKFYFHFLSEPQTLVTAVGNKYEDESWLTPVWHDPRIRVDQGSFYPCYFCDIEYNLCSIPKKALLAVGGFDEGLDFEGLGMDGYSVSDRINILGGFDFKINQTIKSYSLPHGRMENWDKDNILHRYHSVHARYAINPILDFLKENVSIRLDTESSKIFDADQKLNC